MAIFPLALPVSGNSKAADTTTTTITTSASNEALTTNANINGEDAADSSTNDLFGEDVDNFAGLFGEEGPAAAANNGFEEADFLRGAALRMREHAAGQSASQPTSPVREAAFPNTDELDLVVATNGMIPAVAAAESAPATPLPEAPLDPLLDARWLLDIPEDVAPANDALANNAPAIGAPAKRPRGRPPGKAPLKPEVFYRCRYGCTIDATTARGLRKHMMRVHCLFSAAHTELKKCLCGRTYDPNIKELVCSQNKCRDLKRRGLKYLDVEPPRDAQEEADTFAYDNSGPEGKGPRRMVMVEDDDDENAYLQECAKAILDWPAEAPANPAQFNHGLMTPSETPSPSNSQAVVDLTGDDEQVPATPTPTHVGKGEGRAVDLPAVNLVGSNMQLPSLPKKRAGDFEAEGEPAAKRTMRNVSYSETEAFAVAGPAAKETEAFTIAEPALENTNVTDILADLLAMHESDFPEGDFGDVNAFDLPQQAPAQATPFDFGNFAFADATESDAFGFDTIALPSASIDGGALSGFDFPF
ncbi:hypothetical protein Q7P35_002005 [Cladosporium inversicolor]